MRDLQAGSSGKAEAFSTWSEDYYWLSGRLIDAALKERKPENLEQAFQVSERLRARSLVDTLEAAHAVPAAAAPIRQKRGAAMERISAVQRRLLDPALPPADRAAANQELERLEIEEADLRNQLARTAPALTSPGARSSPPWRGCGRRSPPTRPSSPSRSPPGRTSGGTSPAAPGCW